MTDEQMKEIARKHQNSDGPQRWDEDNVIAAIAEAVAAERERCANVVRECNESRKGLWVGDPPPLGDVLDYLEGLIRQPEAALAQEGK